MKFQLFHNRFFNSRTGSYSIVTPREEYDSQITLTDVETDIVIQYFGLDSIQIGNVASNKEKAKKSFFLYPELRPIELNLVFPKVEKHELRLYLSKSSGFKPKEGQIWFLYVDNLNRLVIGSLDKSAWNDLDQIDSEDEAYLDDIQSEIIKIGIIKHPPASKIIKIELGSRVTYKRNSLIASFALTKANFSCEVNGEHKTFKG